MFGTLPSSSVYSLSTPLPYHRPCVPRLYCQKPLKRQYANNYYSMFKETKYYRNIFQDSGNIILPKQPIYEYLNISWVISMMIDLSKDFHTLDNGILLAKLVKYGLTLIPYSGSTAISAAEDSMLVKIEAAASEEANIKLDVPERSVLRPVLFISYFK